MCIWGPLECGHTILTRAASQWDMRHRRDGATGHTEPRDETARPSMRDPQPSEMRQTINRLCSYHCGNCRGKRRDGPTVDRERVRAYATMHAYMQTGTAVRQPSMHTPRVPHTHTHQQMLHMHIMHKVNMCGTACTVQCETHMNWHDMYRYMHPVQHTWCNSNT